MSFTHMHLHTEFSLLDGAIRVDDLVDRVSDLGQKSVAITDHGWLAGAVKFSSAAKKKDIKPIIGSEMYVATGDSMKDPAKNGGDNYHLTVLAANRAGYQNLMRLSSLSHIEGLSYKPRIDKTTLAAHSDGLVVLSGCIGAELPQTIIHRGMREARALVEWYQSVFGDRFFIEVMHHGATGGVDHVRIEGEDGQILMTETDLNLALVLLADLYGIGIVATNDAHYLTRDDGCAHDTLLCLGMGAWKTKEGRMRFPGAAHQAWEFYIKSEAEMAAVCADDWWQTACANTALVADLIEPDVVPMGGLIMPRFKIPEDDVGFRVWRQTGAII